MRYEEIYSAFISELMARGNFDDCLKTFSRLTGITRVCYVYGLIKCYFGDKLNNLYKTLKKTKTEKSNIKATQFRESGNKLFRERKFIDALHFYNKSICFAIPESENIIMAYGNRTAVLFKMGKYKECLEHIKFTKELNINSSKLRIKLEDRKNKCLLKLNEIRHKNKEIGNEELSYPPSLKNPKIIKYLTIRKSDKNQLEIFTRKQLSPGDVVAVSDTYAFYIPNELVYRKCSYCAADQLETILIACPGCTCVMFCNEICQRKAYEEYHKFECDIYEILHTVFHIFVHKYVSAERLFFTGLNIFGSLEKFLNEIETKTENSNLLKLSKDGIPTDRESLFIMTNFLEGRFIVNNIMMEFSLITLSCFLINIIIKCTKFKETLKEQNKGEIILALFHWILLLKNTVTSPNNTREIYCTSPVLSLTTPNKNGNVGLKLKNGKSLMVVTDTIKKNEPLTSDEDSIIDGLVDAI